MSAVAVPSVTGLLSAIDSLSYRNRWDVLRPLRVAYDTDSSVQSLAAELSSSTDFTCRFLAASIAGGSRASSSPTETAALLRKLLLDSDDRVVSRAMTGALSNMSVSEIADIVPQLTLNRISRCCVTLLRLGRGADIDAVYRLLVPLSGEGKCSISVAQQQRLLAFVSVAIWEHLPLRATWLGAICASDDTTNARCWRIVCTRLPEWASKRLANEVTVVGANRVQLPSPLSKQVMNALLAFGSSSDVRTSACGLELLSVALDRTNVPEDILRLYRNRYPGKVIPTLLQKGLLPENTIDFRRRQWRRIRHTAPELFQTLSKGGYLSGVQWYIPESLPSHVRQAVLSLHRQRYVSPDGTVQCNALFVGEKDNAARAKCGEQYFGLKSLESVPHTRVGFLSLLPFPKAVELATAASLITNSDVAIRTAVVLSLIKATCLYPEHITDVLQYATKRSKEQDPWRASFFAGLLQHVPPSRWVPSEHFGLLEELMNAALAAKDLSVTTITNIIALLLRASTTHTAFAAKHIALWVGKGGGLGSCSYYKKWVGKANAVSLWECFEPFARQKIGEADPAPAASTVLFFDNVLHHLGDKPKQLLLDASKMESVDGFVTAIPLLVSHYRHLAVSEIIPAALTNEPDCVLDPTVREVLSHDLQGPHLRSAIATYSQLTGANSVPSGRFATHYAREAGKKAPLVFTGRMRYRWPSSLQQFFGDTVLAYLEKGDQDVFICRSYFEHLRELPGFTPADNSLLFQFARLEATPETEMKRDFALLTLGHMYDDASLKELAAASVDEKRVRTAHLAMKRRLRSMPSSVALAHIRDMSACKLITVQKELVRMIGTVGTPEAFADLSEWAARPDLHPHTQLAIFKSYFYFLDKADVWDLLIAAATPDSKPDVVVELCSTPDNTLLAPWQMDKYRALLLGLIRYPHGQVTHVALRKAQHSWATADDMEIFDAAVPYLASDQAHVSRAAFDALIGMSIPKTTLVEKAVKLPHASSLQSFIDALARKTRDARNSTEREHLASLCDMVTESLTQSRRQIAVAVKLLILSAPAMWGPFIQRWEKDGLVHPGVAAAIVESTNSVALERWDIAQFVETEQTMRTSPSALIRRVGLALLLRIAGKNGWDDAKRAAVVTYQEDKDSWVSDSALLVKPTVAVS